MALIELQRFRERQRTLQGAKRHPFYDWLAANDATFHRDLLIVRNGVKLGDDDELAFELRELDRIQIFDQPKASNPFRSLAPVQDSRAGIFVPGAEAGNREQRR